MASEHDPAVAARIAVGEESGVLAVDDPSAMAEAVSRMDGTVPVEVDELPGAIAAARVRIAELLVDRARRAECGQPVAVTPPGAGSDDDRGRADQNLEADRHAVRFSLVVLALSLVGGIAVYAADGLVLAAALPAAALAVVGGVVLAHRRPAAPPPDVAPVRADPEAEPVELGDGPAVRAAEAHLRRQQAAWKLVWWERDEPVPALGAWSPRLTATTPITLVSVDAAGRIDDHAHATMTATVPAAVRVVVLQARG